MAELETAPTTTEEAEGLKTLGGNRPHYLDALAKGTSIVVSIILLSGSPKGLNHLQDLYNLAAFQAFLAAWAIFRLGYFSGLLTRPHLRTDMALTGVAPVGFLWGQLKNDISAALGPFIWSATIALIMSHVDEAMGVVSMLITVTAICCIFCHRCVRGNCVSMVMLTAAVPIVASLGSLLASDWFLHLPQLGAATSGSNSLDYVDLSLKGAFIIARVLSGALLFLSAAQISRPLSWTAWLKPAHRPYRTALYLAIAASCALGALLAPRAPIHGHNDAYSSCSCMAFSSWLDNAESAHLVMCASVTAVIGLLISCFAAKSAGPFHLPQVIVGGVSIAVAACMPCVGPRDISPILLCPPVAGMALYMAKHSDPRSRWSALKQIVVLALTVFLAAYIGLAVKAWGLSDPMSYRDPSAFPTELMVLLMIAAGVTAVARRRKTPPPLLVPLATAVLIEVGVWTPFQKLAAVACVFTIGILLRRIARDYYAVP